MYGGDAYGGAAYGAGTAPEDIFDVDAMLSSRDALVYTAEIRARRANSAVHRSDDFGRATVGGGLPAGWTSQWTAGTYDVIADPVGGAASGQELQLTGASSAYRCLRLDATGAAIDVDVVASVRMAGVPAGTTIVGGVAARVSGGAGTHTGYLFAFATSSGSPIAVAMYSAAAGSVTFKAASGFAWSAGTRYLLRLQCIGTAIKGKVWAAGTAEPAAWTIEITDSAVAGAGYGGFFSFVNEADPFCDYLAVALDGGPAALAGEETIRVASAEWATAPTDVPASAPFDGRLSTALQFSRSVVDSTRIGINFTSNEGSLVFDNTDGAYDAFVEDYAVDGRAVTVRVGRKTDAFENHKVIFRGVAVDWGGDDSVTVTVRDKSFLLDVPAQPNVYAGTGGAEGGEDLTGKRKSQSFGKVFGVPPVLVDSSLLLYQFHDLTEGSDLKAQASNVYDRGISLSGNTAVETYADLVAASVGAGTFTSSKDGYFRLGSAPSGVVFALVQAYIGGSMEPMTTEVIDEVLSHAGGLADDEIDRASFDAVAVSQSAAVGLHYGSSDSVTVAEAFASLVGGVGGWAGFDRAGRLAIGILTAPVGDPVADFDRTEILQLARDTLPSGVWPPPWRWRVAWSRNYTVFDDFAGAVPGATKIFYAEPYRLAEGSDATILDDHPNALDPPPVEAFFRAEAQAQDEADRLFALFTAGYRLYSATLSRRALLLEIGDLVQVTYPRFGFNAGKLCRVVAIEDKIVLAARSGVEQVEVTVFG